MYNNFFKRGISLIVLIITIVVIVILACAIILSVSKNNPVTNANKAVVQSDFKTLESELNMYISDKIVSSMGDFNSILLSADSSSITYNGVQDTTKSITDILTTLKGTKYVDYVTIAGGKIIVDDSAPTQTKEWAEAVISPHTTCELKDAPDNIKELYNFCETTISNYNITSITINNVHYTLPVSGNFNSNNFLHCHTSSEIGNIIIYNGNDNVTNSYGYDSGSDQEHGYYKYVSTSKDSMNATLYHNPSTWKFLGSSYKVTY